MNKVTFIIIISLISRVAFSQLGESEPIFRHPSGKDFNYVVRQNMKLRNLPGYRNLCLYRSGFVKFSIDSLGRMDSIFFTRSIPEKIRTCIMDGLKSAEGHWIPKIINGKAVRSRPFLLPVEIRLESGCKNSFKDDTESSNFSLFDFENLSIKKNLDCIILRPSLIIHSQRGRMDLSEQDR